MTGSLIAWLLAAGLLGSFPSGGENEDQKAARRLTPPEIGGDVRLFGFVSDLSNLRDLAAATEPTIADRRSDTELLVARLKLEQQLSERWSLEVHAVAQATSPPQMAPGSQIATGTTRQALDLTVDLESSAVTGALELDRLSARFEGEKLRVTLGRQAITWGVNYFWPALDLFAPFAPERVDRDYKPGVDALRVTVPTGDFSELEVIAASQGDRFSEDASLAALYRFPVGGSDLGFMAGRFHGDTVLGAFFAGDAGGTALRAEVAATWAGGEPDLDFPGVTLGRREFIRASVGLDRQLTGTLSLTTELAWNGFGADEPGRYLQVATTDRVTRGEVTSLGQRYVGVSLGWLAHPLLTVSLATLANLDDESVLFQPGGSWSLTGSSELQFGMLVGFGDERETLVELRSEYGDVPVTLWGAFKFYF